MAPRLRSAARRAKELLQSGVGKIALENDDKGGLSSEEEDELDDIINGYDEINGRGEKDVDPRMNGSSGDAQPRSGTYSNKDIQPKLPQFQPKRPVGPQIGDMITRNGIKAYTRAIDFFGLFMTTEMLQMICVNTNLYGWLTILDKPTYAGPSGAWDEITMDELKSYLGLIIMMGFIRLAEVSRYWSQATLYGPGWACRFMSRLRYKAISSMIHVSNPSIEDPTDKLTKIRPFLDHMKSRCLALYQPMQQLSIDERMVKSKGRSGIKQYMPSKPVRFGYKIWCLCDSRTGYTVNFNVYTGRREKPTRNGLAFDVVGKLMEGFLNQGYHVFFDNFFTSLSLVEHLWLRSTPACGTSVTTRRGFPAVLKDKDWASTAKRGDSRYVRTGPTLCLQWKDTKPVCTMSTMHAGHEFVMVKRRLRNPDDSFRQILIRKPAAIHEYNQFMGGVDLADQLLERYSILQKCRRWWKTLFFHLVDLAVLNGYLLFRHWQQMHPEVPELRRPPGYSHLQFREELARQLGGISDDEMFPTSQPKPREKSFFGFDGVHMPEHSGQRRNCRVCYFQQRKECKTNWICIEQRCGIPLCFNKERNCFKLWHTDEFQRLYRGPNAL